MRSIFTIEDDEHRVFLQREDGGYRLHIDDRALAFQNGGGRLVVDGVAYPFDVVQDGDTVHVWLDGETQTLRYHEPVAYYGSHADSSADDTVQAPMPGTVVAVHSAQGAKVARGDTLVVIESMKLETAVKASRDGVVATVHVVVGQSFERLAPLVTLAAEG